MRVISMLLFAAVAASSMACSTSSVRKPSGGGPYEPGTAPARDPIKAQKLTLQAAELMAADPVEAEALLREALTADLWHGPAHNNLGVLLLKQDRLYEAAGEFEWARTLLPGHPDPRMNLGFVMERAGKVDDALACYDTALEVFPGHLPTVQALVRLQIRERRTDARTVELLDQVAMRGPDPVWREWALWNLSRYAR